MIRSRISSLVLGCSFALSAACSSNAPVHTGTETNWLKHCDDDSDCGAYACYCGVCSASCKEDGDCEHESLEGSCHASTDISACEDNAPKRVCVLESQLVLDAAVPVSDANAAASSQSTSFDAASGSEDTTEQPTFAYAAIPCERRAPSQCYQGDECYAIFAAEVDGNERLVGCTTAPNGESLTCALSPLGEVYQVSGDVLPLGWTTTAGEACEPECFSPWRNLDDAQSSGAQGCPCTAPGSVCIEGVGFECIDATRDLRDDRTWQVTSRPCEEEPDCSGGFRLTECLARYEVCAVGGVVLDTDQHTYCGATLLPCGLRSEAACSGECEPVYGASDGHQTFGGCVTAGTLSECGDDAESQCVQQLTPKTNVPARGTQPVAIETCEVPSGFSLLDPGACEDSALPSSCGEREEASCVEPCYPYVGRRSPGGAGEFVACGDRACSASRTVCAENSEGEHVEFFGCVAPGWTEVNVANCGSPPRDLSVCPTDIAPGDDFRIELQDAYNYELTLNFSVQQTEIGSGPDLTLDWSALTRDFFGHSLGAGDITNVTLLLMNGQYEDFDARLEADVWNGDWVAGVTFPIDGSRSSVTVPEMFVPYTGGQPPIVTDVASYFDPEQADPAEYSYVMLVNEGEALMRKAKMYHHVHLDPASDNHTVAMTNDSTTVTAAVVLANKPAIAVPLGVSSLTIDWNDLVNNGLGHEFIDGTVEQVRVLHFPDSATELEASFGSWELNHDVEYSGRVVYDEQINLASLINAQGQAFEGIDDSLGGTWLLVLDCAEYICRGVAPWFAARLVTCSGSE